MVSLIYMCICKLFCDIIDVRLVADQKCLNEFYTLDMLGRRSWVFFKKR